MRYVTGFPDRSPVRVGLSLGDEVAAMHAVIGALMALARAIATGWVITSTCRSSRRCSVRARRSYPNTRMRGAPPNELSIAGNSQPILVRLCKAIGRGDLATDPRFATNVARVENVDVLDELSNDCPSAVDLATASEVLAAAGVPAGPFYSIADIAADPRLQARGAIARVDGLATPGISPRLRRTPGRLVHAGRSIGADHARVIGKRTR